MSRRAIIKRGKIRREWSSLAAGTTKRQARRSRRWLQQKLQASLLDLMATQGPIKYGQAGRNLFMDRIIDTLMPRVSVEVVDQDREKRQMTVSICVYPSIYPGEAS